MPNPATAILTPAEMYRADALAVEAGVASLTLMERAGKAVAAVIQKRFKRCRVAVLCGPGNNGGDGYVVARLLKAKKWPVTVYQWSDAALAGDAAIMSRKWKGTARPLAELKSADLVVDALFGAGLSRELPAEVTEAISAVGAPVVAVDVPSGLDGLSGQPRGSCLTAAVTVTFFRKKPAHVLYPGRAFCGEVVVADIGIPAAVLGHLDIKLFENSAPVLPPLDDMAHKYSRGAALILSGGEFNTGAARLAAVAAARIGAGVVSLCGTPEALRVHAAHVSSIMLKPCGSVSDFRHLLGDRRIKAVCVGPAAGVSSLTRSMVMAALERDAGVVLDADALTSFALEPDVLFAAISKRGAGTVLTPHEGEFARLFKGLSPSSDTKVEIAREAARHSGAVVLLKGPDTVIAAPDGLAVVNTNGSAKLATAGSGDVLAGLITGLMAQGLSAFEAARAAAWLHADAANRIARRSLMAEDLLEAL